jgi:hypothetical protein
MEEPKKVSIEELMRMVEEDGDVEILPNGEVRRRVGKQPNAKVEILTKGRALGDTY